MCSGPFIPPAGGGLPSACAVGPSSLLREEVYLVCSGPLIPPERAGLPSVRWAFHPSRERRFTRCAVGPASFLREKGLPSEQWALHPS